MLLQTDQLEKDIQRSLDRLGIVFKQRKTVLTIPAFFYSASLLNNYAKMLGADDVKPHYFQTFKYLIEQFGKLDFSNVTKNNQEILNQILQIVDSELFIDCLRPDIKSARHTIDHSYNKEETIQARSNQNFQPTPQQAGSALKAKGNLSPIKTSGSIESSDFLLNQFDQLWESIERLYRQHNIDEAYQKAMEYIQKISKKTTITANRQQFLYKVMRQYAQMIEFYQQFDKGEWQLDKQQKGITLEYKVYEQQKMVAIRITGEFDVPLQPFLSIICEIDLMGDYVPFCYDCKELKVVSRNQRIGTSKIYIPLLTDRETYFYAVGYDRQKVTGGVFLYSKTINEDYDFQNKYGYHVPKQSEYVRLQYKFFIVQYLPLTKERAKIRLSSKIDMKMNFLPLFILNKSARIFAFDYFKNVLKIAKNYKGSNWQKKVNERPDLYDFFKKKVDQMFG